MNKILVGLLILGSSLAYGSGIKEIVGFLDEVELSEDFGYFKQISSNSTSFITTNLRTKIRVGETELSLPKNTHISFNPYDDSISIFGWRNSKIRIENTAEYLPLGNGSSLHLDSFDRTLVSIAFSRSDLRKVTYLFNSEFSEFFVTGSKISVWSDLLAPGSNQTVLQHRTAISSHNFNRKNTYFLTSGKEIISEGYIHISEDPKGSLLRLDCFDHVNGSNCRVHVDGKIYSLENGELLDLKI